MYIQKSRLGNFGASPCDELQQAQARAQVAAFAPTCKIGPAPLPAHICSPELLKRFNSLTKGLDECKLETSPEYRSRAEKHIAEKTGKTGGKTGLFVGLGIAVAVLGVGFLVFRKKS